MDMNAKKIYLIKDLANVTGYSIHTIKYYSKLGLISEVGRSPQTNFRYFDDTTAEVLKKIRQLRTENKTLSEIKEILKNELL